MYNKAEEFISNTTLKLQEWEDLGHDKCYRTEEYDVRLCHEDCKKREKGDFAKKCKKDGGLFKCCVRYENIHQRVIWNKMESASKAFNVKTLRFFYSLSSHPASVPSILV